MTNTYVHGLQLNPPLCIEVTVTDQGSERSCIYVLGGSILPLSKIYLRLNYRNVPTVWYILFFILSLVNMIKTLCFDAYVIYSIVSNIITQCCMETMSDTRRRTGITVTKNGRKFTFLMCICVFDIQKRTLYYIYAACTSLSTF